MNKQRHRTSSSYVGCEFWGVRYFFYWFASKCCLFGCILTKLDFLYSSSVGFSWILFLFLTFLWGPDRISGFLLLSCVGSHQNMRCFTSILCFYTILKLQTTLNKYFDPSGCCLFSLRPVGLLSVFTLYLVVFFSSARSHNTTGWHPLMVHTRGLLRVWNKSFHSRTIEANFIENGLFAAAHSAGFIGTPDSLFKWTLLTKAARTKGVNLNELYWKTRGWTVLMNSRASTEKALLKTRSADKDGTKRTIIMKFNEEPSSFSRLT